MSAEKIGGGLDRADLLRQGRGHSNIPRGAIYTHQLLGTFHKRFRQIEYMRNASILGHNVFAYSSLFGYNTRHGLSIGDHIQAAWRSAAGD
jgi:hypothetical protein